MNGCLSFVIQWQTEERKTSRWQHQRIMYEMGLPPEEIWTIEKKGAEKRKDIQGG